MARIVQGQVVAPFAFDVGSEAPLEGLSAMLATTPVQPWSRKKQTPMYMQLSAPWRYQIYDGADVADINPRKMDDDVYSNQTSS